MYLDFKSNRVIFLGKGYDPEQTELVLPSCDLVGQWQQSQRQVFIGQLLVTPNGRHCSNAGRKINKKRVVTTRVSKWPGRGVDNDMRGTGGSSASLHLVRNVQNGFVSQISISTQNKTTM